MNNDRTTKEIKIESNGAIVVLFDYITGRDKRAIEGIFLDQANLSQKTGSDKKGETEVSGVKGSVNHLMQDAAFKAVIQSIKIGADVITDKNKVIEFILDLPADEYTKILEAINEITDPKKA